MASLDQHTDAGAFGDARKRVSIVIPCYRNGGEISELARALDDLHHALRPSHLLDVVLVDDGSDDGTRERLIVLHEKTAFKTRIVC